MHPPNPSISSDMEWTVVSNQACREAQRCGLNLFCVTGEDQNFKKLFLKSFDATTFSITHFWERDKGHHRLLYEVLHTGLLKQNIRGLNISITIVNRWSAEVPRTPEESVRYCKISSWQEEENIWDTVSSRSLGEVEASCDRGVKGETKETEEGVLKVMLSNSVYFIY